MASVTDLSTLSSILPIKTLAVDIGGTGVKSLILDAKGTPLTERIKVSTPKPALPEPVLEAINQMAAEHGDFDRVAVGFPGVVRHGRTMTAVNLHSDWEGFNLEASLYERLGKPVRVANDADVQGYGVVKGEGVELVITLGTGVGSALFVDGILVPNLELAHHHLRGDDTYEDLLGKPAFQEVGKKQWNKRLAFAIDELEAVFNYDQLYLGGGNSKKITLELSDNVAVVSNLAGLLGGIALWRDHVITEHQDDAQEGA